MVEPVSTLAVIEATAAAIGTAVAVGEATATGNWSLSAEGCNYPSEITDQLLVGEKHALDVRDCIKFHAVGGFYDDTLAVSMGGFASMNNDPIQAYTGGDHPNIPANRFLSLQFAVSGRSETLSIGTLSCNIAPYPRVQEPAYNPAVVFRVSGRFDPAGPGDTNYEFEMVIDTYGQLSMRNASSEQAEITDQGDHVLVYLNYPITDGT